MTLRRYLMIAVPMFVLVALVLTQNWYRGSWFVGLVMLVIFFIPTYIAMSKRLEHRIWIVFFNLFCFPVAWIMAACGRPEKA
jgi:hypothetical protein